jgi:hypothetical protein
VNVGDRVKVERDESLYPSKGTWRWFRGKTGVIEEVNNGRRVALTEYGVRLEGFGLTWFKVHELRPVRAYNRKV